VHEVVIVQLALDVHPKSQVIGEDAFRDLVADVDGGDSGKA
jgi:hypothetical protein